jgi:hypothetical protein
MTPPRLALVCTALLAIVWLASCGKSEPPPAPKVEAPPVAPPAPAIDAGMKQLAGEVYVFAYPLVLTDVTRAVDTAGMPSDTFRHDRTLPDASSTDVSSPNADFLYSQAWLDLSKGPVLLSTPDTRGRYFLIAMLGAWTNVVASLGKRTTGTDRGKFAIVGPRWNGKLPGGVFEVRSPTDLAWLYARTQTSGGSDVEAAARIQKEFKLAPLQGRRKPSAKSAPPSAAEAGGIDTKTAPRVQVAQMDAGTFFTRFAMLLEGNPPTKDDAPMREKMEKLGIEAGHPFDIGKLDPVAARSVEAGAKAALDAIASAAGRGLGGDIRNGWTFDLAVGRWGTDYGKRAVAAYTGLGINAPEDAIFMATHLDGGGHRLDGANRYVLHFDKGDAPPANGFWSLSLYDNGQHFVANALNRYNIGSTSHLQTNADGSLDIYLQTANPGPERESNWLPAPAGPFNLVLRIYWPKPEVVEGKWVAPGIRPAT